MIMLAKLWVYCKKYYLIAILIVSVIITLFACKKSLSLIDELKKIKEVHDEELRKISEAQAKREAERIANEQSYQNDLNNIQIQHNEAAQQLEIEQAKKIEELSKESPDELAIKLAEAANLTLLK